MLFYNMTTFAWCNGNQHCPLKHHLCYCIMIQFCLYCMKVSMHIKIKGDTNVFEGLGIFREHGLC